MFLFNYGNLLRCLKTKTLATTLIKLVLFVNHLLICCTIHFVCFNKSRYLKVVLLNPHFFWFRDKLIKQKIRCHPFMQSNSLIETFSSLKLPILSLLWWKENVLLKRQVTYMYVYLQVVLVKDSFLWLNVKNLYFNHACTKPIYIYILCILKLLLYCFYFIFVIHGS